MRIVSCELSEPLILDGRWVLTILDVNGQDVLLSIQDQDDPDFYEEVILEAQQSAEALELVLN